MSRQRWVIALLSAFLLLRLPSFLEPTWYSDAGTYANIGWALNHGARLYVDVWDNKPPATYWLAALLIGHLPPALAMPIASSLLTAITTLCVGVIGRRLGGTPLVASATVSYVVVASLPSLDGNLFNAEICGATCVALAMVIVLGSTSLGWRVVAGVLVGMAVLFKAVFAADVVVVIGVPAIIAASAGRQFMSASSAKAALAIVAGCSLTVGAAAGFLLGQGTLAAAISVVTRSDLAYVAAYGGGGIAGIAGIMLTGIRVLIPICAGVVTTTAFVRRGSWAAGVLAWWLGWDVAAAMLSGRGWPHYVQQAEPALCLAVALAATTLWRRHRLSWRLRGATVMAVALSCQLVLWIPSAEAALASGSGLPGFKDDGVALSQLPAYYVDGYWKLIDSSAGPMFDRLFPTDLSRQRTAVNVIDAHSGPRDRIFVWGTIPWVYVLSDRTPAGRYVTLNSAYHIDGSAQASLLADLEAHPPRVLIVEPNSAPDALRKFLIEHRYQHVLTGVGGDDFWLLS